MEENVNCGFDKVEIFDGGSSDATKHTFCGNNNPGKCQKNNNTFRIISLRETAMWTLTEHRNFMGLHFLGTFIFVSS